MTKVDVVVIGMSIVVLTVWLTILTGWVMRLRHHQHPTTTMRATDSRMEPPKQGEK